MLGEQPRVGKLERLVQSNAGDINAIMMQLTHVFKKVQFSLYSIS